MWKHWQVKVSDVLQIIAKNGRVIVVEELLVIVEDIREVARVDVK
jgi:hypothetical protein